MGDQSTGYSEQYGWGTSLLAIVSSMGGGPVYILAIVSSMGGGPIYILAIVSSMGGDQPTGYSEQYGWGPAYWL